MKKLRYFSEESLNVLTRDGFFARFEAERKNRRTNRSAYEATEIIYFGIVGKRKYRSFNAFRQALYRYRRKKL